MTVINEIKNNIRNNFKSGNAAFCIFSIINGAGKAYHLKLFRRYMNGRSLGTENK